MLNWPDKLPLTVVYYWQCHVCWLVLLTVLITAIMSLWNNVHKIVFLGLKVCCWLYEVRLGCGLCWDMGPKFSLCGGLDRVKENGPTNNSGVRTCWENRDQQIIDKSVGHRRDKLKAVVNCWLDEQFFIDYGSYFCRTVLCSVCVLRTRVRFVIVHRALPWYCDKKSI